MRVRLERIRKTFGSIVANADVDLELAPGEVVALLGENAAGKSTLMKCLYGYVRPDSGSIYVDGARVEIATPRVARTLGIGMVFQETSSIAALTVRENLALGAPDASFWSRGPSRTVARSLEQLKLLAPELDPSSVTRDLSSGERQLLELAKVLGREPRVLILDEPTALLTRPEAERLWAHVRAMSARGHGVVMITHKLEDVAQAADRVVVMRAGRIVHEGREVGDRDVLLRAMLGEEAERFEARTSGDLVQLRAEVSDESQQSRNAGGDARSRRARISTLQERSNPDGPGLLPTAASGSDSSRTQEAESQPAAPRSLLDGDSAAGSAFTAQVVPQPTAALGSASSLRTPSAQGRPTGIRLELDGVCASAGTARLDSIGFALRAGEVLGIAGVTGNGQELLARVIAGVVRPQSGCLSLDGSKLTLSEPTVRNGIAYIPDQPRVSGCAQDLSVLVNLCALEVLEQPFLSRNACARDRAKALLEQFDVRPRDLDRPAGTLSGGNLQKLVVARELSRQPRLIVACFPTLGLDVRAAQHIVDQLTAQTRAGAALVWISEDLDPLLEHADQIAVMHRGQLRGPTSAAHVTRAQIGAWMTGVPDAAIGASA